MLSICYCYCKYTCYPLYAGPGGFSEYFLLYGLSFNIPVKGVGMSLNHLEDDPHYSCNWNLQHHLHCPPKIVIMTPVVNSLSNRVSLRPDNPPCCLTIVDGDGTGNIQTPANISILKDLMLESFSNTGGVDFVCADGGFDSRSESSFLVDGHVDREDESVSLLISQVIGMLTCLRIGGDFIVKAFDMKKVF